MQRFLDLVFSFLGIVLLSPVLGLTIILLRFSGEREVFFLQKRIGKNRKLFSLYKFATMLKASESIGTGTLTIKNDPRILPLGKFLRKSKINELPQLVNVFLGHMSLVGPRPLTQNTFSEYSFETQNIIASVRPGLSGIGSIIFRSEEEILGEPDDAKNFYKTIVAPYKGELEKWYVSNNTLLTYFRIIAVTIVVVGLPRYKLKIATIFPGLPLPPNDLKNFINLSQS